MERKISLFKMYWDKDDVEAVKNAVEKGMYWAIGPHIEEFENGISRYIGTKYSAVFNSGTSALHAILLAHGIGKGDEVIVPSFTFIATANAPLFVGAKPIFADIEDTTFGLNPEDVQNKITKKTKAIIPVHYGGSPCLIRELKEIAEDRGLLLIEDAAEAFGAKVENKKVGTFGDSAILSFCQNKVITTGEGGAVLTDSKEIYEKLKLIRSHGRLESLDYFSSSEYMDYVALGYNFRMPNLIAALGVSQLKKVDKIIAMRRKNVQYLTNKLSKVKEVMSPITPDNYFHVYQIFTIRVANGNEVRDNLADHLVNKRVMAKVFFYPVHLTQFYRNELGYRVKLPITEKVSKEVLSLPMYPSLKNVEMDYIAGAVNAFFEAAR